jgi:hypothetical protein
MINTDYVIAIPSYKRHLTIKKKTLTLLKKHNIDKSKITIFVANQEEYDLYNKELECQYKLVIGQLGMKNIRNFISDYYDFGINILNIDDDMEQIISLHDYFNLDEFIKNSFELLELHDANLFGIYPVNNKFFMSPTLRTDLRFIMGGFFGCRNMRVKISIDNKEDVERSILYYLRDGIILRFEDIAIKNKIFSEKGGMQFDGKRTKKKIEASAKYLVDKYPNLCSLKISKKRGTHEIKLKDKR